MLTNIQIFFSVLILIFFISMLTVSYKKNLTHLLITTIISLILININQWQVSVIGIIAILFPLLYKRLSQTKLTIYLMLGSILGAYFLLKLYLTYDISITKIIIAISLIIMCVLSIIGILEKRIKKYLIYSNIIQFCFIIVDLSVAKINGNIGTLGIIQIFNYTLAGSLFFITLIILNKDKLQTFKEIQGSYYKDHWIGIFAIIACASLAGLPGLNIFVSEWLLFVKAFVINPSITVLGIFIALLLFIMYFKVIYILVSSFDVHRQKSSTIAKTFVIILGALCLLFGVIFPLQFYLLRLVI